MQPTKVVPKMHALSRVDCIIAPLESKKQAKEKDRTFLSRLYDSFVASQDRNLESLLDLYASEYFAKANMIHLETLRAMKEAEPGLFIRAGSRPDLSGMVGADGDETLVDGNVATGGVKNDEGFLEDDAIMQEAAYLSLLLYLWRSIAGCAVQQVHGFVVCGPRCRDIKARKRDFGRNPVKPRYCVAFFRLISLGSCRV